jgi:hypothetical protein
LENGFVSFLRKPNHKTLQNEFRDQKAAGISEKQSVL